jgi:AraC-like DNA-binding protein
MPIAEQFTFFNKPIPKISLDNGFNLLYLSDKSFGKLLLHTHNFIELIFVVEGNVSVNIEGFKYQVQKGNIMVIPNNLLHCTIIDKETIKYERFVIHLDLEYMNNIMELHNLNDYLFSFFSKPCVIECSLNDVYKVRHTFNQIFFAHEKEDAIGEVLLKCTITELIITLYYIIQNPKSSSKPSYNDAVTSIIHYINENFTNPSLDLKEIVNNTFLSTGYLCRIFKSYTGTSIYNFVIYKRLEHSKYLICKDTPILDACMQSGFNDYTTYLKSFKKVYKITPTQFRKQLLKV